MSVLGCSSWEIFWGTRGVLVVEIFGSSGVRKGGTFGEVLGSPNWRKFDLGEFVVILFVSCF